MKDEDERREKINKLFKYGDYVLVLRPERDGDEGLWTGQISVDSFTVQHDDYIEPEEYEGIMTLIAMMCGSMVLWGEDREQFDIALNAAEEYAPQIFDHLAQKIDQLEKPTVSFEGNVIKLDFDTPTGGNA